MAGRRARRAGRRGLRPSSTPGWSAPRCSISWSARASSTAARWSPPRTTRRPTPASSSSARARWRSPATPGSATSAATIEAGLPEPPGRRRGRGGRHLRRLSPPRARRSSTRTRVKPLQGRRRRRQRDGGADGRPAARAPRPRPGRRPTGSPTASSPTTSRTRCCPRTASSSSTGCSTRAPTSGSPGTATPTAASSSTTRGEFVDGDFLTALLARQVLRQAARRDDPLRRPRQPRGRPTRSREPAARSYVNRVGHAFFKHRDARARRRLRRRGLRPLLLPRLLVRRLGHDPGAARARAALGRGPAAVGAGRRASASATSSPARSTPRSPTSEAKMQEIAERYADGEVTWLDGVSVDYPDWHFNVRPSNTEPLLRLNLESLVSREDMERKARRGPGADPVVTPGGGARTRAAEAGIHRLRIPTPFAVGRVNCYLIEDEPLTLVDTGPNSGKSLDELERQLAERRATRSRRSSWSSSPTSTSTTSAWSRSSPRAPAPRWRRSTSSSRSSRTSATTSSATTSSPPR